MCAALCAIGLQARELQIWKEVDGIFTADPFKSPSATLLSHITVSRAVEFSRHGAEVINLTALLQILHCSYRIPIAVKNVRKPQATGTMILPG